MQHEDTDTQAEDVAKLILNDVAGWAPVPNVQIPDIVVPLGGKSILVESETGCIILSDAGGPITSDDPFVFDRATRIDTDIYVFYVNDFEGHVTHMYLDCVGLVTVGYGHQIPNAEAAMEMKFYDRGTTTGADKLHIKNAYNLILNSGLACEDASEFKEMTHIDLDLNDIQSLFDNDVRGFLGELNEEYKDFETYPASAQYGMLDLIYNIGNKRFFYPEFPLFHEALAFRNWIEVAEESHRNEVINGKHNETMARRNVVVRDWFLEAFEDEPFFINTGCPYKSLSMIAG